jgi:hypothetical protein
VRIAQEEQNMPETLHQYVEVFDMGLALKSVGGDREFFDEIVGLTQAAWPTLMTDIREGMARGDLRAVEISARLAKAAARNISARRAYESALQLHALACKGDMQAAWSAIASLEREVEMLLSCLSALTEDACYS